MSDEKPIDELFDDALGKGTWDSIMRCKQFEDNNEDVPEEIDKFINDNYHVYGGAGHYEKRHILLEMVMTEFNLDYATASCYITYSTT